MQNQEYHPGFPSVRERTPYLAAFLFPSKISQHLQKTTPRDVIKLIFIETWRPAPSPELMELHHTSIPDALLSIHLTFKVVTEFGVWLWSGRRLLLRISAKHELCPDLYEEVQRCELYLSTDYPNTAIASWTNRYPSPWSQCREQSLTNGHGTQAKIWWKESQKWMLKRPDVVSNNSIDTA